MHYFGKIDKFAIYILLNAVLSASLSSIKVLISFYKAIKALKPVSFHKSKIIKKSRKIKKNKKIKFQEERKQVLS